MECEEFLSSYSDFLDQTFERHDLPDYCAHLLSCRSCAEYDRVMRRGLHIVRQLDPPAPEPHLVSRVQRGVVAAAGEIGPIAKGWAGIALGVATAGLVLFTSMAVVEEVRDPVALPPVVVEAPAEPEAGSSLFGPAPRFRPEASLLHVSDSEAESVFAFPEEPLSLFRRPLKSTDARRPIEARAAVTTEGAALISSQ